MTQKSKQLGINLVFASIFGGALLIPEGKIANIVFLALFIGGFAGLVAALLIPLYAFAGKGIMWQHYIPQSLIIIFMFVSPFTYLAYVFGAIFAILLIKNFLAFERYEDQNIT